MGESGGVAGPRRRGGRRKGSGKRADASAPWALRAVQALADGSRWAIINQVSTHESTVGEIARQVGLSVACTSKHISILKDVGLLFSAKNGREVVCRLAAPGTPGGEMLEAVGIAGQASAGDSTEPSLVQARLAESAPELEAPRGQFRIIHYKSKDMDDYLL